MAEAIQPENLTTPASLLITVKKTFEARIEKDYEWWGHDVTRAERGKSSTPFSKEKSCKDRYQINGRTCKPMGVESSQPVSVMEPAHNPPGSEKSILVRTLQLIWLPIAVFVAFELTVPDELSILRSLMEESHSQSMISVDDIVAAPVPPLAYESNTAESLHAYFGIEDVSPSETANPDAGKENTVTALGQWSGRFAGVLAGDEETDCWSAYDFDLVLIETESGMSGSGSYWVDPASCSMHSSRFVAFIEAKGKRAGSSVEITLVGSDNQEHLLSFNGLLMRNRLSGWFYLPDGQPVSGPVVLARK